MTELELALEAAKISFDKHVKASSYAAFSDWKEKHDKELDSNKRRGWGLAGLGFVIAALLSYFQINDIAVARLQAIFEPELQKTLLVWDAKLRGPEQVLSELTELVTQKVLDAVKLSDEATRAADAAKLDSELAARSAASAATLAESAVYEANLSSMSASRAAAEALKAAEAVGEGIANEVRKVLGGADGQQLENVVNIAVRDAIAKQERKIQSLQDNQNATNQRLESSRMEFAAADTSTGLVLTEISALVGELELAIRSYVEMGAPVAKAGGAQPANSTALDKNLNDIRGDLNSARSRLKNIQESIDRLRE